MMHGGGFPPMSQLDNTAIALETRNPPVNSVRDEQYPGKAYVKTQVSRKSLPCNIQRFM